MRTLLCMCFEQKDTKFHVVSSLQYPDKLHYAVLHFDNRLSELKRVTLEKNCRALYSYERVLFDHVSYTVEVIIINKSHGSITQEYSAAVTA